MLVHQLRTGESGNRASAATGGALHFHCFVSSFSVKEGESRVELVRFNDILTCIYS